MWACFCWLQKSSVCCLTLKTRPSCPGITPMLHFTTGLITGSLWSTLFISGRLPCWASPFEGKDFLQVCKSFYNNNYMWCFFLIWWHLTILRWTGATLCTLTTGTMRLLTLLIVLFLLFAPCICNCVASYSSNLFQVAWRLLSYKWLLKLLWLWWLPPTTTLGPWIRDPLYEG